MLRDITGKLNKYQPCFKRIDFEAILNDMDTRIDGDNSIADKAVTLAKLADTVQASIAKADTALQTVVLANLNTGIAPSHVVKYAGKITWSGSGASLATTVAGVAATDIVVATIQLAPTQAAYLVSAAPTLNTVTLTLSAANTGNNAIIGYQVLRAAV